MAASLVTSAGEASASTATISYATVALDPGASPGYVAQLWAPRDTVTIQQPSPGTLSVSAAGSAATANFSFAAPAGQTLAVGHYASAVEPGTERAGDASIHVSPCGSVSAGSFDVRDVDLTAGAERIDVVYDVTCGGQSAEGEVAVNEPSAVSDVLTAPQTVGFPATYPTKTSTLRPLTYVNIGSANLHPSGVQITGSESSRFHVASDGCTGHAIAPGGSCTVEVTFAPATSDPATETASLVIADDSAEGSQTTALNGTPVPGYNSAYLIGELGDYVVG
ncbi:MAG: hypothetical protein JO079_08390, partial [Frankiaceae bacterium]|nr:hypothetical protein [Frankiaceae bacterium]